MKQSIQNFLNALSSGLLFLPKLSLILVSLASILLVPLGLPGTWILVIASLVYSFFYDFVPTGHDVWVNGWLIGMALLGEVIEFLVGTLGGKKLNVSNGALASAFIGGLIGAFVGVPVFLIGSLLGLFLGVFLGAFVYEIIVTRDFLNALKAAIAVFFSRLVASGLKTAIAVGMFVYLFAKLF